MNRTLKINRYFPKGGSMKNLFMVFLFVVFSFTTSFAYDVSLNKDTLTQGECLAVTWSGFGDTCNVAVYKGTTFWTYANTNASYAGSQEICTYTDWELRNDYKIRVEEKSNPTMYVNSEPFSVVGLVPYLLDYQINGGAASTDSRNVYLQFNYTDASPTHYMASENSSFSGASWLGYNGNDTISFTLSDYEGMKFVYFKLKNAYGESNVRYDNISYTPVMYYDISGYVLDGNGEGIDDVSLEGASQSGVSTDTNGYYVISNVPSNWLGTISPEKSGYTFSPESKTYTGLTGDMSNQNFTAVSDYYWLVGNWGECCESCNGGRASRDVDCIRNSDSQKVLDEYCQEEKPVEYDYSCTGTTPSHLESSDNGESYTY